MGLVGAILCYFLLYTTYIANIFKTPMGVNFNYIRTEQSILEFFLLKGDEVDAPIIFVANVGVCLYTYYK